jgi:16S rRNA (guanine527-N7)-methyltransferase
VRDSDLQTRVGEMGLELEETTWGKIAELRRLWQFYGRSMNLTARLDEAALNTHILESLQAVALASRLDPFEHWLDVGSGAGFPGLVVAACIDARVTCVEPRAKRASFLELALRKVGRADCRVIRGRIEQGKWTGFQGEGLDFADVASARAVFEPVRWMAEARGLVRPGGVIVVHLGVGDADPVGETRLGRVDGERWSIRAYAR